MQTWTTDCYDVSHTAATDLQAYEDNFASLKSLFSGASAPANTVAGMPWFYTTNKILEIRNNANDAWLGVLYGPATLKTWIYANTASDGWVIDATVTDRVLSLKGGANAYNANGGTNAGTWTIAGFTVGNASADHTHSMGAAHTHGLTPTYGYGGSSEPAGNYWPPADTNSAGGGNTGTQSVTHNHTLTFDGTTRPAAAIGTLQYPNV
jgi:hypothetical protein